MELGREKNVEFPELNWPQIVKFFFTDSQLQAIKCYFLPPCNTSQHSLGTKAPIFPPQSIMTNTNQDVCKFLSSPILSLSLRHRIPMFLPLLKQFLQTLLQQQRRTAELHLSPCDPDGGLWSEKHQVWSNCGHCLSQRVSVSSDPGFDSSGFPPHSVTDAGPIGLFRHGEQDLSYRVMSTGGYRTKRPQDSTSSRSTLRS